jgi:phage shock protein C
MKKLYRSKNNKIIAGVCGGIGEYFNIDPTIIRLLWLLISITGGGLVAYIIAWIIIPKEP